MRDSMRGRTDHSPRPTLSEDPTLDRDNIPLAFFGTVAAHSGPCDPSSIASLSYIVRTQTFEVELGFIKLNDHYFDPSY